MKSHRHTTHRIYANIWQTTGGRSAHQVQIVYTFGRSVLDITFIKKNIG